MIVRTPPSSSSTCTTLAIVSLREGTGPALWLQPFAAALTTRVKISHEPKEGSNCFVFAVAAILVSFVLTDNSDDDVYASPFGKASRAFVWIINSEQCPFPSVVIV